MKRIKGIIRTIVMLLLLVGIGISTIGLLKPIGASKPLTEEEVEAAIGVPYTIDTIPVSNKRIGLKRRIKYIVVHNTANPTSTARNERDYLTNITNLSSTSWNIAVDDTEIIEAIPVNEMAFHAGASEGNRYGIGIEICESGNYQKAEEHAVKLIAYLMKKYHIPLSGIMTHQDFSGKSCPRMILDRWEIFLERVEEAYNQLK